MSENMFDIIFTGDICNDVDLDRVKQKAAHVFRLNDTRVVALFSGKRTVLRQNLDQSAATKYQKILMSMGMITVLQSHSEKLDDKKEFSVSDTSLSEKRRPTVKSVATKSAPSIVRSLPSSFADELTVLPVGTSVDASADLHLSDIHVPDWGLDKLGTLLAEPVHIPINNTYDRLSAISLAALATDLLTDKEKSIPPIPPSLTSIENITVTQSGEDLLNASEKTKLSVLFIDTSHLSVLPSEGE